MPVAPLIPYPTAAQVMNRARAFVNDSFQGGAGRILTNAAPFSVEYMNGALEYLQDRIRNRGVITLEKDNIILTPITPLLPVRPGVQQRVAYQGFFNGETWAKTPFLPPETLSVLEVWERQTGSGLPFQRMLQKRPLQDYVPSFWIRLWEYREDSIIFVGSSVEEDLRIRIQTKLAPIAPETAENQWSDTTINILASINSLAHIVAYFYARARGAAAAAVMQTDADANIKLITNRYTRQNQHTPKRRRGFGGQHIGRTNLPF